MLQALQLVWLLAYVLPHVMRNVKMHLPQIFCQQPKPKVFEGDCLCRGKGVLWNEKGKDVTTYI
jgi:hypothetical protein